MTDTVAFIGIGSNLGDRISHCRRALEEIGRFPGTHIVARASFYDTEPLEMTAQNRFINTAVKIRTGLSPEDLLSACQEVERRLGRERSVRYGPRTIDLDLLLYGETIMKTDRLVLPHPKLHTRRFVLEPLAEIAPEAVHPALGRRVDELLREAPADQEVRRIPASPSAPSR